MEGTFPKTPTTAVHNTNLGKKERKKISKSTSSREETSWKKKPFTEDVKFNKKRVFNVS